MTELDTLLKDIGEFRSWAEANMKKQVSPLHEELDRFKATLAVHQKAIDEERRSRVAHMDDMGRVAVREGRLAGMSPIELGLLRAVIQERLVRRPDLAKVSTLEEINQARASIAKAISYDHIYAWEERAMKAKRVSLGPTGDERPQMFLHRDALAAWRGQLFQTVRRALDSTTAASGDELVPTFEAAELWMDVNLETKILPLFMQSPMPTNPFDRPGQLGNVNWYPTAENEQGTTTTVTTTKATLTAYELKAGIPFSDTLEEDAVIALVPEIRRQLALNAAQVIDDVLLNGDTTTTNGINSDGATIAKSTAAKAHWLLGFDGLIHLPLIDNTAQRRAFASTLTAAMYNNNMIKLGKYAGFGRLGDVVHVSDINTALTALTLAQVETHEKLPRATISSGEITQLYGIPYIMSEQMKLADTDGKVTDSGGNTKGRALTFNATQWMVGFRRGITFEPDREPGKSQTTVYVSFRIAFTERSGTRSSASHTALQYDISGVT